MKAPTREQVRAALRRVDLLAFVQDTTQDYSAGWAHRMLAERLERFSDDISARRSPRLMIFTPPRFGKSQLVSRRFPVWHLARNPSHEVMLATYAQALSNDLNRDALQCAQMPETLASFPEFKLAPERQAVEQWKTDRGGGMVAIGVGGPATGRGAHALVIDDAVKGASEAASEIYREGQKAWYQQNARTRLAPGGGILITMTRWHQDDLAGWLLKQEQDGGERWEVICLPAIAATEERDAQGNVVRRAGEALHPERFDLAALTSLRAGLSPYAWAALYQQTPVPDGGGRIKSAWLAETRYVTIPHDANRVLHSWDTASKAGQLNDYSVCSVIRPYNQRAYLQDVYRQRLEFPALVSAVKSLAQRDNPYAVLIEDKGSGQALIQTLRRDPTFRWSIVPVNPMADKITRMDGVTPWLEGQRFYLPQSAPWLTDWETEVYSFPAAAHDDQIDSLSQALDYLGRENGLAVWRVIAEQRNHGPQRPVAIDTRMAYAIRGR